MIYVHAESDLCTVVGGAKRGELWCKKPSPDNDGAR